MGREARESHPPAPERTVCRQVPKVRSKVEDHSRLLGYTPCHSRIRERPRDGLPEKRLSRSD